MKLFANGCSFTWGAEIIENELGFARSDQNFWDVKSQQFREENSYPFFLHKSLNTDSYINRAWGGASNQRTVRTTLDFFISELEKGTNISDYVAIIQWTSTTRYEIYDNETKDYLHIYPMYYNFSFPHEKNELLKYKYKLDQKNFDDVWYSELVCLSSFFHNHKIKYLFATMDHRSLPNDYYKNAINWLGTDMDSNCILDTKNLRYKLSHPNIEGHKYIAERLYKRLKELYNI